MSHWLRGKHEGRILFGTTDPLTSEPKLTVYEGNMFESPTATGMIRFGKTRMVP